MERALRLSLVACAIAVSSMTIEFGANFDAARAPHVGFHLGFAAAAVAAFVYMRLQLDPQWAFVAAFILTHVLAATAILGWQWHSLGEHSVSREAFLSLGSLGLVASLGLAAMLRPDRSLVM